MATLLLRVLLLAYYISYTKSALFCGHSLDVNAFALGPLTKKSFAKKTKNRPYAKDTFATKLKDLVIHIDDPDGSKKKAKKVKSAVFSDKHTPYDKCPEFKEYCTAGSKGDWDIYRKCLATLSYTEWGTVVREMQRPFFRANYISNYDPSKYRNAFKWFEKALWDVTHQQDRWESITTLIAQQTEWKTQMSRDLGALPKGDVKKSKYKLLSWQTKSAQPPEKAGDSRPFPPGFEIVAAHVGAAGGDNSIIGGLNDNSLVVWRGFMDLIMLRGDDPIAPIVDGGNTQRDILYGPSSWTMDIRVAIEFAAGTGQTSGTVIRCEIPAHIVADHDALADFGLLDVVASHYVSPYHVYQKEVLLFNIPTAWLSVELCVDNYAQMGGTRPCAAERTKRQQALQVVEAPVQVGVKEEPKLETASKDGKKKGGDARFEEYGVVMADEIDEPQRSRVDGYSFKIVLSLTLLLLTVACCYMSACFGVGCLLFSQRLSSKSEAKPIAIPLFDEV